MRESNKNIELPSGFSLHLLCTFPPPTEELRVLWAFGNEKHGVKAFLDKKQNLCLLYYDDDYQVKIYEKDIYKSLNLDKLDDSPQHVGCQIGKNKNFTLELYHNGSLVSSAPLSRYKKKFEERIQLGSDFQGKNHIGKMYVKRTTFWPSAIKAI